MKYLAGFVACVALLGAAAAGTRMSRREMAKIEKTTDASFETMLREEPAMVLGYTRSVYLEGYGMVFSTEVDLLPGSAPNPFRMNFTPEEIQRIKEKKRNRISTLKDQMRNMLVNYSKSVDIPLTENIALAVTIPYSKIENVEGMPRQLVMSAPRSVLRTNTNQSASVTLREFF